MSELLAAIEDLKVSAATLRGNWVTEAQRPAPTLAALTSAIEALGQVKAAKNIVCPDEYIRIWQNRKAIKPFVLSPRAIRFLHWEPTVVLDPQFHYQLDDRKHTPGARDIQGLVRACHVRWRTYVTDDLLQRIAARRLRDYAGPNRTVKKWQASVASVLGAGAAETHAATLVARRCSPREIAAEWAIDESTPLFSDIVRVAIAKARLGWGREKGLVDFVCGILLVWPGWEMAELKEDVSACILSPDAQSPTVHEPLMAFLLGDPRFGDPRHTNKRKNWAGVKEPAMRRVIEWLSRGDITFFFDHAFPRGGDPHGRKPFWLKYVPRVLMSRPLLSPEDLYRLRPVMRQLRVDVGNFGSIIGNSSAFVLDFGEACAIEFNRIGACYVYPRSVFQRVVPELWASAAFREKDLKRRDLLPDSDSHRVVHRPGWEDELRRLLARYGVRPE